MEPSNSWQELCKFEWSYFGIPVVRNHHEIIIAPEAHTNERNSLYRFDVESNTYSKWIEYTQRFRSSNHTVALDHDNDIVYVIGYNSNGILEIDLKAESAVFHKDCMPDRLSTDPTSIVICGTLHIFSSEATHLIFDRTSKQCTSHKITSVDSSDESLSKHGMVFDTKRQELLLLGGIKSNHIHSYNLQHEKWTRWEVTMPMEVNKLFGHVITSDCSYVLTFGGCGTTFYDNLDEIWVLDLKNKQWSKSEMKCPRPAPFSAFLMDGSNEQHNEKLVHGYLRNCWNLSEFSSSQELPADLIRVIVVYCTAVYLHLMEIREGTHWRILLNEILDATFK